MWVCGCGGGCRGVYVCVWGVGRWGGGSTSSGGLAMSFSGQLVLHWSPPDTQLSSVAQEAVACDSGHTPVNCLGWRAKPGVGSQLGLKPSGEPDRGCLPKHAKTGPGGVSGRERFSSNGRRAQRATASCAVDVKVAIGKVATDVVAIHS